MNKLMQKFVLTLFIIACPCTFTYANGGDDDDAGQTQQNPQKLSGKIVDATGAEGLPGATVRIKGSTVGTSADANGNFTLNVPKGATLVISYIGYVTKEILYNGEKTLEIVLNEEAQKLDEAVVVGYTTQKKESLTGSLQSLSDEKLKNITTPVVENMLSGKAPGVYVASGSGQPGSTGTIVIRGKSTINGSTDPLWVVDGVIVGSGAGALNPADIETMTVLKDAASTAIYGSQGANGVIVVTTRGAKTGKINLNASVKFGITNLNSGNFKVMNGAELYDLYSSFSNANTISFPRWNADLRNSNFSWWDLASKTGFIQDYNVSLTGGGENLKTFFSVGLYDETGAVKGYDYTRYTTRFKIDYKPFKWLTIKPQVSGSLRDVDDKQYSVGAMYSNLPWDSPYDADGNIVGHYSPLWVNSNSTNYLYDLQWDWGKSKTYEFMGSLDFDVKITDWLTFSSVNNYKYNSYDYTYYSDPRSSSAEGVSGRLDEYHSYMYRRYTNHLLRFNKTYGKHSLNAILAYEFNDYYGKNIEAIGTGLVSGYPVLDITTTPEKVSGGISEWAVQSYFFNAHYSYDNRYMAQFSLRRDGASNFGTDAKYGNFFSISGAWNVHKEEFFKVPWINVLKLRMAYGSVGNRPTALYPQYDLYSLSKSYSYNGQSGALISQIGRRNLTWEKTMTFGVGLDLTIFDRARFTFDYYNKRTTNLLYAVPVSGLTGVTSIYSNVGELTNNGFEITASVDVLKTKDLYWGIDANIGFNTNKVKKLYGTQTQIINQNAGGIAGSANKILRPGLDADTWYLPEWAGVDPANGSPLWYKTNSAGDRETTSSYDQADKVICGSYTPDFFGGFSTNLTYLKFDLEAVFGYSVGGKIYNYSRQEYDSDGAYSDRNQMRLKSSWKRWEKPGDIATHPIASYNNSSNSNKASSRYLESGTYLKMRSLSIGYNLALPQYKIQNLRVYLAAENVFCITSYSGVDPEIPPAGDGSISGVTSTVYPSTRKFILGINITF